MAKQATIYDVASLAGVSITTVSRVLNTPALVAAVSREKIVNAMKELNFTPKAEAIARARKDFKRIGVLVPFFTAPSFVQRLRGISAALSVTDYELITYSVESQDQLSGYLAMLPLSRRIDGLIILALPVTDVDVERLIDNELPTVLIEISHPKLSSIEIDNHQGGRLAAEHLLSKGYKKLAFIGEGGEPAYSLHATDQRLAGFKTFLEEKGTILSDEDICFHEYGMKFAVECAKNLLKRKDQLDAVFAASDLQAVGFLKAAREENVKVPEDVAVLGFDDIDLADYMGISTINQALDESGRTAVELLLEKMKSPSLAVRNIRFQLNVIERYTT